MARKPAHPTRRVRSGSGHRYFLDGEKAEGVTKLIGGGLPKPALINWAGTTVSEYVINHLEKRDGHYLADSLIEDLYRSNEKRTKPFKMSGDFPRLDLSKLLARVHFDDRDLAAKRGTEVHRLAADLAEGLEVDVPEELTGHVDSYLAFLEEWRPENAIVEATVINRRRRYMGAFDLLCELPDPWGLSLLDIKTSRSGIFAETALQVLAYSRAEAYLDEENHEIPMPKVESLGAIWVRADGFDVYRFNVTEDDYRAFLYAAEVARWAEEIGYQGTRELISESQEAPS